MFVIDILLLQVNPVSLFQDLGCQHCLIDKNKIIVNITNFVINKRCRTFKVDIHEKPKYSLGRIVSDNYRLITIRYTTR